MKVLIVDDNSDDVWLIARHLASHFGAAPVALWAHNPATMADGLAQDPDAILCDYNIPGFEWPSALQMALEQNHKKPFIVFSGSITDDRGRAAITDGADDYVSKDQLELLGPAIERVLRRKAVFGDNQQAADNLVRKAGTGPLKPL